MSDILHIKDAYYFEIPKAWAPSERESRNDFPDYYVRLDPDYQDWESHRLYEGLARLKDLQDIPAEDALIQEYHAWGHEAGNFAKPFDRFLEESASQQWFQRQLFLGKTGEAIKKELIDAKVAAAKAEFDSPEDRPTAQKKAVADARASANADWAELKDDAEARRAEWQNVKHSADDVALYKQETPPWSAEKIAEYNEQLSGKLLIPQPFGTLKNNYEPESGFCISKFMILELLVAVVLVVLFRKLAARSQAAVVVRGKLWNMFEAFLLFIRDGIAKPAIGGHDADRFVPLLWTIFMFVLFCNLLGMIPWLGAPTSSFSVTLALAMVTFATVVIAGSKRFGIIGFWKNQVPSMGLPLPLAVIIVPMLFLIEVLGLFIKHAVLGFRLLANMVAGHMVLLAIMGLAIAAANSNIFYGVAAASVIGSALISCLELFVAFLQAYVFTFLSALFIGAAVHHH
ncbi:MAG: F0F1 ATP synthase subunit A [Planctomycetales bacterium]|nr:F0F1 ATP synthase subunit A [Planctomycetales bacterium]